MAVFIRGAKGSSWRGADWVMRNAFDNLFFALRTQRGGGMILQTLQAAMQARRAVIDLSELLADPQAASAWDAAVMRVIADYHREGNSRWNDPDAFTPFLGSIRRLCELVGMSADAFTAQRLTDLTKMDALDPVQRKLFLPMQ